MVLILSSAFVFAIAKIRFISLIYNFLHIILLKKIDKIRDKRADFVIELKANQRSLRYGLEDPIKTATPTDVYKEGPYLEHGRIESRICRIYRGEELIVDREKWNGNLTVIEILTSTEKKSDGKTTSEQRLYISSLDSSAERLSQITKQH